MARTVVFFVEGEVFGGSEKMLLQLIAGLDRRRWRPIVLHRPEPGLAPFLSQLKELQVKTWVVPWLRNWHAPIELLHLVRLLKAERVTVFHASLHWPNACRAGLLAAWLARVPAILATFQLWSHHSWSRREIFLQWLRSYQIDRVIVVSNVMAENVHRTFHIPRRKIHVVRNSVPSIYFNPPVSRKLRGTVAAMDGQPIVLTIARLDQQKGIPILLQAAVETPQARFVLVGDGPNRTMLEELGCHLKIADRVFFLGHRDDIPELLTDCDLFVLPSLYEGLPLVVLEAMAVGKPVIATNIEGTREAIVDQETGILVPPGEPRALANAIRKLLDEPRFAQRLANAGKARAYEQFRSELMIQKIVKLYAEILCEKGYKDADA